MQKTINFGPFLLKYLHLAIFFGPLNLGHFKFRKLHFESMWKSNSCWENSVQRHLVMSTSYFVTNQVIIVSLISGLVSLANFYSSLTPRQKKLECLSLRRRSESLPDWIHFRLNSKGTSNYRPTSKNLPLTNTSTYFDTASMAKENVSWHWPFNVFNLKIFVTNFEI